MNRPLSMKETIIALLRVDLAVSQETAKRLAREVSEVAEWRKCYADLAKTIGAQYDELRAAIGQPVDDLGASTHADAVIHGEWLTSIVKDRVIPSTAPVRVLDGNDDSERDEPDDRPPRCHACGDGECFWSPMDALESLGPGDGECFWSPMDALESLGPGWRTVEAWTVGVGDDVLVPSNSGLTPWVRCRGSAVQGAGCPDPGKHRVPIGVTEGAWGGCSVDGGAVVLVKIEDIDIDRTAAGCATVDQSLRCGDDDSERDEPDGDEWTEVRASDVAIGQVARQHTFAIDYRRIEAPEEHEGFYVFRCLGFEPCDLVLEAWVSMFARATSGDIDRTAAEWMDGGTVTATMLRAWPGLWELALPNGSVLVAAADIGDAAHDRANSLRPLRFPHQDSETGAIESRYMTAEHFDRCGWEWRRDSCEGVWKGGHVPTLGLRGVDPTDDTEEWRPIGWPDVEGKPDDLLFRVEVVEHRQASLDTLVPLVTQLGERMAKLEGAGDREPCGKCGISPAIVFSTCLPCLEARSDPEETPSRMLAGLVPVRADATYPGQRMTLLDDVEAGAWKRCSHRLNGCPVWSLLDGEVTLSGTATWDRKSIEADAIVYVEPE